MTISQETHELYVHVQILTGRPFGPFSPTMPWRPASPFQHRQCSDISGLLTSSSHWRPQRIGAVPTFSPSSPGVPSLPSLPGIPCCRHRMWFTWFWQMTCFKKVFFQMHLLAPLWALIPQDHLWDQFYPVQRYNVTAHLSINCARVTLVVLKQSHLQFRLLVLWILVAPFLQHHPGDIRWNTHSYSLMGPAICSGCELLPNTVFTSTVSQTRRDSLSFRWCQRCRVCLWSQAGPRDKHTVSALWAARGRCDCFLRVTYSVSYRSHWAL